MLVIKVCMIGVGVRNLTIAFSRCVSVLFIATFIHVMVVDSKKFNIHTRCLSFTIYQGRPLHIKI
jgi:hypothetical protein